MNSMTAACMASTQTCTYASTGHVQLQGAVSSCQGWGGENRMFEAGAAQALSWECVEEGFCKAKISKNRPIKCFYTKSFARVP
eukprot:scaffold286649_cov14-Tisochrysis_lutea.AAC.1